MQVAAVTKPELLEQANAFIDAKMASTLLNRIKHRVDLQWIKLICH
jgi:hypothetical protein